MDHTGALEEEATIDGRLQDQSARRTHQAQDGFGLETNENTGLLDEDRRRAEPITQDQANGRDSKGEQIWHGDEDFKGMSRWKTPSVCSHHQAAPNLRLICSDLLDVASFRLVYSRIRRCRSPKSQPDTKPHLSRLLIGQVLDGSKWPSRPTTLRGR